MNCFRVFDTADKPSAGDAGKAERCSRSLQQGQERSVILVLLMMMIMTSVGKPRLWHALGQSPPIGTRKVLMLVYF